METVPQHTRTGIIYCRVSSKEQVEGTSLDMQEKLCLEYAERNRIQILGVYTDKGESAKTADRKQFMEAIQFCGAKKPLVHFFIVYKLDRFARNQIDHVSIRALLNKYGTELCSVTEPIDASPIGKALEGMLSIFAEFDNNVRAERSKSGMYARLQQGIWPWSAPIGYYRIKKGANLSPDPKQAPYIRMIFEEYAKGTHTFESLAKHVQVHGFRTPGGRPARKQLMEKILRNPIYYACMEVKGKSFVGTFEPIISEELFWRCQPGYQKKIKREKRVASNPLFPLRQIVQCAECKRPLTGSSSRGRSKYYSYYHHWNAECGKAASLPKDDFERRFVGFIQEIIPSPKAISWIGQILLAYWKDAMWLRQEGSRELQREIEVLRAERERVFEFHRVGKYTDEEFAEQKKILNERLYAKQLLVERSLAGNEFDAQEAIAAFQWAAADASELWHTLKYPLKVRFQKLLFREKVLFDGENFGTGSLSAIFALQKDFPIKLSTIVPSGGRLWNQILEELREWQEFKKDYDCALATIGTTATKSPCPKTRAKKD